MQNKEIMEYSKFDFLKYKFEMESIINEINNSHHDK